MRLPVKSYWLGVKAPCLMVEGEDCLYLEQLHELNLSLSLMMLRHLVKHEVLCAYTFGPYRERSVKCGQCMAHLPLTHSILKVLGAESTLSLSFDRMSSRPTCLSLCDDILEYYIFYA